MRMDFSSHLFISFDMTRLTNCVKVLKKTLFQAFLSYHFNSEI